MTNEEAIRQLDGADIAVLNRDFFKFNQAIIMAISAIRQREHPQWISVKDRLPDYMGEVLVIVSGKPHENITLDGAYEIAEYDPVEGWILEMWPEWCSGVVTHWMPLPEPPKADVALEGGKDHA